MKVRLIAVLILLLFCSNAFIACNSEETKSQSEAKELCSRYEYRYGELQELVNAIKNHSSYQYHSYNIWDKETIQDIKAKLSDLDSINCSSKKNLDFANIQIALIQEYLSNKEQEMKDEALNGDDLFMDNVQINSQKILFDDNMKPYVKMVISNNTNRELRSLNFLVNYCGQQEINQFCYKFVLLKEVISPLSTKELSFKLPQAFQMATDYPKVELVEILRSDGTKVKTYSGFRFVQDKTPSIYK